MPTKKKNSTKSEVKKAPPKPIEGCVRMFEYKEPEPKLPPEIRQVLDYIERLFLRKNKEYRSEIKWDANFQDAAPVQQEIMTPLFYCMTLCSKQDDAFWKAIKNASDGPIRRQEYNNIHERISDAAVFRIIALALLLRMEESIERD